MAAGDAGAWQTAFPAASRLQLSCRSSGQSPSPCRCLSERGLLLSPPLPLVLRLGCHWARFEGAYLQTCLTEAGNSPVKTTGRVSANPCAWVQRGFSGHFPRCAMPSSCPHLPRSLPLAAPPAFGGAQALAEFRPDRCTSAPPGTQCSPTISGERTPAAGRCWDPGAAATGGMGGGAGGWGAAALQLGAAPGRATSLGCHSAQESSFLPFVSCGRVGGSWWGAAQPFSDLGLSVCLSLLFEGLEFNFAAAASGANHMQIAQLKGRPFKAASVSVRWI